jgi:hypothetical protein
VNEALYKSLLALPPEFPGLENLKEDLIYLLGCGKFDQFSITFRGLLWPEKCCSFCDPKLSKNQPVAKSPDYYLKENDFHGEPGRPMFLVVPWKHTTCIQEVDWSQVGTLINVAISLGQFDGGGIVTRFGNPARHSGTMRHLHINIASPSGEQEYRVPLSKTPKDRKENYARLLEHRDELAQKGGLDYLFPTLG